MRNQGERRKKAAFSINLRDWMVLGNGEEAGAAFGSQMKRK